MLDERERLLLKSEIPSDEETHSRYEKIRNDPDKIEWEILAYYWPYASRRKKTLQKNAFYCAAPMFAFIFFASGFDLIETVAEPWTWILVGFGMFVGYYYSGLTVFNYHRHHYMLSKHGLITEEHAYSPPKATKIAQKMVGVLAVLTVISVVMIGPVALVGAGGLGITWLVLANVNFEKYGLMRQVGSLDEVALIRIHDDSDESRDYFRLFMKTWDIEGESDEDRRFSHYGIFRVDVFCNHGDKNKIIDFINSNSKNRNINIEMVDLFSQESRRIPTEYQDV
ncbi:hypothetical protein [Photobacterium salinisoli]|uniref:hypothetical protein n=1 Tax=Photobacterium salinisoli TaxID=1616783 RepID=UPI000EA378F4|nr:hypothetical protein [Photobacterium salinisoli]